MMILSLFYVYLPTVWSCLVNPPKNYRDVYMYGIVIVPHVGSIQDSLHTYFNTSKYIIELNSS